MFKTIFGILGMILAFIIFILILTWVSEGNEFFLYKFFAPRQAAVERQVFVNTPSYVNGMNQNLDGEILEYYRNTNNRSIMGTFILDQVSSFPMEQLTPNNREFVEKLRADRINQ